MFGKRLAVSFLVFFAAVAAALDSGPLFGALTAQSRGASTPRSNEWRTYGADLASTRYSPLDQINKDNFSKLRIAWRLSTDAYGSRPDTLYSTTPLFVGGVLYATVGTARAVVAIDAASGDVLWKHTEDEGPRGQNAPRTGAGRGVSYWSSADGSDQRIIYVTPGYRMIALNAKTGAPVTTFGQNGVVDLKLENDQDLDLVTAEIGLNATPLVAGDVVVVGAAHRPGGSPRTMNNPRGYVRGYDAKTGKRLWIFHTVPKPGEFGYDTWENESALKNGNTGAWAQFSADLELGLVYVPVEMPPGDYYGGNRPGNTLFDESLVALDLKTGKRKWHYQTTHHGLWDYDLPCAPILFDLHVNGRRVRALAQPTKQAFLFVLNRETGEPIWPIEERSVPESDRAGRKDEPDAAVSNQTGAVRPAGRVDRRSHRLHAGAPRRSARGRQAISDRSPLHAAGAEQYRWPARDVAGARRRRRRELARRVVRSGNESALHSFAHGGVRERHRPGQSRDVGHGLRVRPGARGAAAAGAAGAGRGAGPGRGGTSVQGLPLVKPPYDRITAYNMNTGDIMWQKTHSSTPDDIKSHPALQGLDLPRLGQPGRTFIGVLTTKTLLIAGEGGVHRNDAGERIALLRAYDKATGADVGAVEMPDKQTGSPMTYMVNGKQYIVVAVSGVNGAQLVAYALQ